MHLSGRLVVLVFAILFFSSLAQGVVLHEDFDNTDEDLYAVVGFLSDAKLLCEESLEYSYLGSCTVESDPVVRVFYSQDDLNLSLKKAEELADRLSYSSDVLDELEGKAGSYEYLKDFLIPIRDLGFNVSVFVTDHYSLVLNFSKMIDFIGGHGNNTGYSFSLANASKNINYCREDLQRIKVNLNFINESFSTQNIEDIVSDLENVLDRYEGYVDLFVKLLKFDKPTLLVYSEKDTVYLGEQLNVFGYFIANESFVSDQTVDIYWGNARVDTNITDSFGRFETQINVSLIMNPGLYNLSSRTFYNNSFVVSNVLRVNVLRIPTSLKLSISKNDFYLDESIVFTGRLVDYKNIGFMGDLVLDCAGSIFLISSDSNGYFSYTFNNSLGFGKYYAMVEFEPVEVYADSVSKKVFFNVNTPTILTLNLSKSNDVDVGDNLIVSGRLSSAIDDLALSNKTIKIYIDSKMAGSCVTDFQGFYSYTLLTEELAVGSHSVYAVFVSEEDEWRDCSSLVSEFDVVSSSEQGFIYYVAFILLALFGAFFVVLFREKILGFFRRKPSRVYAIGDIAGVLSQMPSSVHVDIDDLTVDTNEKGDIDDSFRDSIISRYQLFLKYLSGQGMVFGPGVTHLDVRKSMIRHGFSKKPTDIVTRAFEYAMYSPYPIDKKHVSLFNKNMRVLFENSGGVF